MNAGEAITAAMAEQRQRESSWISKMVWLSDDLDGLRFSSAAYALLVLGSDVPLKWLRIP